MFLTLEDPRARVKGSRDPLGVQTIWAAFARHIIANLTTVTDSLRGFTVLLLGRYFGERLLKDGKIEDGDVVDVFLRVEQVCGYARCLAPDDDAAWAGRVLGIERVKRRISAGLTEVSIGVTPDATILSDQKSYGLWGLFSVSARVSKLLSDDRVGLSSEAREFVESHYLPLLSPVLGRLDRLVEKGGSLDLKPPSPILGVLEGVLGERLSAAERRFYRKYLCDGERCGHLPTGRQATLRRLLETHSELHRNINRDEFVAIKKAAQPEDPGLARRIGRILVLEALLAPCDLIFALLQTRHGQPPSKVAASLAERWGGSVPNLKPAEFEEISDEIIGLVGEDIAARMAGAQKALSVGDYRAAIEHLLAWNEIVMMHRSASPWVRLDDRGALDVRYRGAERELPPGDELSSLWRSSYFVNSLKALMLQTAEAPTGQAP